MKFEKRKSGIYSPRADQGQVIPTKKRRGKNRADLFLHYGPRKPLFPLTINFNSGDESLSNDTFITTSRKELKAYVKGKSGFLGP